MNHKPKFSLILLIPFSAFASQTPEQKTTRGIVFIPGAKPNTSRFDKTPIKDPSESSTDDIASKLPDVSAPNNTPATTVLPTPSAAAAAAANPLVDAPISTCYQYQFYVRPKNQTQQVYQPGFLFGDNPGKVTEFFPHIVTLIMDGKWISALKEESKISDHLRRGYESASKTVREQSSTQMIALQQILSKHRIQNEKLIQDLSALIDGSTEESASQKLSPETIAMIKNAIRTSIETRESFQKKSQEETDAFIQAMQQCLVKISHIGQSQSSESTGK